MDGRIIPLMIAMTAVLILGMGYVAYTTWRSLQAIAWNVVNAAFVLEKANPNLRRRLDAAAEGLLPEFRMVPGSLGKLAPEVRLGLYAIAMQREGMQPSGSGRGFSKMSDPHLARSAKRQIRFVRYLVESEHKLRLTELDAIAEPA